MTAIEFEVDIECRECGKTLDATVVRSRHSVVTVSVEPCSECISDANNDGIERDKKMSDCNHDPRFHLMGAVNGCCACQLERLSQERDAALEQVTAINETLEMVRKGWDAEIIESWKWRKRCDELEQQLAGARARIGCVVRNCQHLDDTSPRDEPGPLCGPTWAKVAHVCGIGSTKSVELCREHGIDPFWDCALPDRAAEAAKGGRDE
jgi:hypothetical protein